MADEPKDKDKDKDKVTTSAPTDPPASNPQTNADPATLPTNDEVRAAADEARKMLRAELAAEHKRVAAIAKACGGRQPEIEAKAVEEGWTAEATELAVLRAERAKAPAVHVSDQVADAQVLEAACVLTADRELAEKQYEAKTLEAAQKQFRFGLGPGRLLLLAAQARGYVGRDHRDVRGILRHAFSGREPVQAAFSTVDISGILSNVANKFLLDSFMHTEQTWRMIATTRPVNDFKTITSYRLTGTSEYEEVGPGGEIKHGELGEESFTNRAKTYAKMFALTRQDLINDDLGALTKVPAMLGWGAGLKLNKVFWTAFLDDAAFFTAGLNNYFEGAATLLQLSSLETAVLMFRQQVDAKSNRIGLQPAFLLVPPELEGTAQQLYVSMEIRDTTASTKYLTRNVWVNRFKPLIGSYLSDSGLTGYSATAWYLLADPRSLSTMEVCFLDGKESPTVEQADADFNVLGVQMRGYHDFGTAKQEHRAGVKSKGAA